MTTEYRPGIPSHAHIEAATRLGLEWEEGRHSNRRWRFEMRGDELWCDFCSDVSEWELDLEPLSSGRITDRADIEQRSFRPIRPYGTPVDWETLDAEVARVAGAAQPQGFRADLWRRIAPFYAGTGRTSLAGLEAPAGFWNPETDARWTVYQELKPLYDLVDDAQGEAAMPRDVEAEWDRQAGVAPLRNFAAVLDAVAERRVAERMRGQTPANPDAVLTVTSAQPEPRRFADVRPDRHGWRWWLVRHALPLHQTWLRIDHNRPYDWSTVETVIPTDEQGNPVSWESIGRSDSTEMRYRQALAAEGLTPGVPCVPVGTVQAVNSDGTVTVRLNDDGSVSPAREGEAGVERIDTNRYWQAPRSTVQRRLEQNTVPLPRFTADELDDVDHTATTKLDETTLRRGKLPTVEQIAKYREVRARRMGGTVADALKESCIDCEVAQYVLERWAGGLGNEESLALIAVLVGPQRRQHTYRPCPPLLELVPEWIDARIQAELSRSTLTLDTTEPPDTAAQQARQQTEERRQRLAQIQAQIAAERAAAQPQDTAEPCRFDLIEPDPQADPAASIRAWEARQAAAKREKAKVAALPVMPAAVPRRPAIEVVDAEEVSW